MPRPNYAADAKKYGKFDAKVKSSAGTSGTRKIKILLDAAQIYKGV
tara:strand:+ start:205 stop:342 length:138 start_codon:yes stop_codon:yes gene_type:complete